MQGQQMPPQVMAQAPVANPMTGLEYLGILNEVKIRQVVEIAEVMTGLDMQNRYSIVNPQGWQFLFAQEESDFCNRIFCKDHRGFIVHIKDASNQEVITLQRDFNCCVAPCCSNPANRYSMTVCSPTANLIGTVRQSQYCLFFPKLSIEGASGQEVFKIEGPRCVCHGPICFDDVSFRVFPSTGGGAVADISRVHAGLGKECFTKANNFSIKYFQNMDVNSKILILSATFLIDMMFFEHDK